MAPWRKPIINLIYTYSIILNLYLCFSLLMMQKSEE
ncbi:hypothetical protein PHA8399_00648 [Leisingera aquaemixtae]|uniref:Uncharacterized protein n=1 Tax=Leisingera aquaemixtae TaxID=1396826 RepID=A0A0P1H6P8_9RHOB|nr:hypothetical protein PHA8399_00648 [Leisingera aquaemixtae]